MFSFDYFSSLTRFLFVLFVNVSYSVLCNFLVIFIGKVQAHGNIKIECVL